MFTLFSHPELGERFALFATAARYDCITLSTVLLVEGNEPMHSYLTKEAKREKGTRLFESWLVLWVSFLLRPFPRSQFSSSQLQLVMNILYKCTSLEHEDG